MKNTLLILALIMNSFVASQWSSDPSEPQQLGSGIQPQIATCNDGSTYIAWLTSGSFHIYLQYFDPEGNPQFEEGGLLVSNQANSSWIAFFHLNLGVDSDNNAIITTVDQRTGVWEVYGWKVSPDGIMLWGEDGIAITESGVTNLAPRFSILLDNSVVVSWAENYSIVHVQRLSPEGDFIWNDPIIISEDNAYSTVPKPILASDGNILLQWLQQTGNPPYYNTEFMVKKFTPEGDEVWANPTSLTGETVIPSGNWTQQFISDENGGAISSWTELAGNNQTAMVNATSISGEQPWGSNGIEVSDNNSNFRISPKIALCSESGDIISAWNESNGSQSERGIYGQRLSPGGEKYWGDNGYPIVELNSDFVYLDATIHDDGEEGIISFIQQSSNLACDIISKKVDESGNLVWEATLTTTGSEKSELNVDQTSGGLYLAWSDNGTISAHSLRNDGELGVHDLSGGPGDVLLVPSEYETIQTAIDASSNGDTILVAPGTYVENINYNGKNIVIGSYYLNYGMDYFIEQTIIDGDSSGSVVSIENGEDSTAVMTGFTIQNGYSTLGGGIKVLDSEPTIISVKVVNNIASELGAGFYLKNSNATLENVTVKSNQIGLNGFGVGRGAGIYSYNSVIAFDPVNRCNIYENTVIDTSAIGHDISIAVGYDDIEYSTMDVILDTFTVLTPTDYYATPVDSFTFDILNEVEMVAVDDEILPSKFELFTPYPNPFNPTTTIRFNIGVGDALLRHPTLTIFDITGRMVEVLVDSKLNSGQHEIQWDASSHSSGIYFVELVHGENRQVQKLVFMK